MPKYLWIRGTTRYVNAKSGVQVKPRAIRRALESVVERAQDDAAALTRQLVDGEIDVAGWLEARLRLVASSHKAAAALGAGGLPQMGRAERERLADRLYMQARHMRDFAAVLQDEDKRTDAILSRDRMYSVAIVGTYEAERRRQVRAGGRMAERRVLGGDNHCARCEAHAARGWVEPDDPEPLPDIGDDCDCLSNCRCSFEFREAAPQAIFSATKADATGGVQSMVNLDIGHAAIRSLIDRALKARQKASGDYSYCWIQDVFEDTVAYQCGDKIMRCTWEMDDDLKVKLGKAEEVIAVPQYAAAPQMDAVEFAWTPSAADVAVPSELSGHVIREGMIFRAGQYPRQSFAMTAEELKRAAAGFADPVDVDLEHVDTLLSGKIGKLIAVWPSADGTALFGRMALPKWLDEAIGTDKRKVSVTFNRESKSIIGIALTKNPVVADAVVMAQPQEDTAIDDLLKRAALFSGRRNSASDEKRLQTVHDMTVELGAMCGAKKEKEHAMMANESNSTVPGTTTTSVNPPVPVTPEPTAPAPAPVASAPAAFAQPADTAAQIASLQAQLQKEREIRIAAEAASFADSITASGRALPAHRDGLIAMYRQAALDDAAHGAGAVEFSETVKPGSRVEALRALFAVSLGGALLTQEQIDPQRTAQLFQAAFAQPAAAGGVEPKPGEMTPERKASLLKMTETGRRAAATK